MLAPPGYNLIMQRRCAMAIDLIATQTDLITGEELAQMGDIGPCELVRGRIVSMSPTGDEHGGVEILIGSALLAFVKTHNLGRVRVGEVGVYVERDPDIVRGADAIFISHERYAQKQSSSYLDVAPELVVEILSPNDAWSKVMQKLREYFAIGVRLIWVADPATRTVFAYRSITDVREFTAQDELPGDDVLPGFVVPVAQLFED
jgi:Uma2 family endonuclease